MSFYNIPQDFDPSEFSDKTNKKNLIELLDALKVWAGRTDEEDPAVADVLFNIVSVLDELDADDAFGTEGWRHSL